MARLARTLGFMTIFALRVFAASEKSCEAVVVFRSGSEVYDEAIAGIREALTSPPCRIRYVDLASQNGAVQLAETLSSSPKLATALGIGAVDRLADAPSRLPLLPVLVLRSDLKLDFARRSGVVYADVPLSLIADRLRATFPGKSRLGMIRRPSQGTIDPAALAYLRKNGFDFRVVECSGPDKLLDVFESLKGKVDFVIAQPDTELYNSATLKPLILASLERRLPVVGFSAAFVRAGAIAGIYPDFRGIGRQAGDMMLRILSGDTQHLEEEAQKVIVAVNPRVARLIGIDSQISEGTVILK